MLVYFARRVAGFVPLLLLVSAVSFLIIELPPGDYLTSYVIALEAQGNRVSEAQVANLSAYYGLDKPVYVRYFTWLSNILTRGNLGWSFAHDRPVSVVIGERLGLTVLVAIATLIFTYVVAVPIGVFSAVRQYSFFDYFWTFWGFAGLAIPNFLLALVLLWISFRYFGVAITGLFAPEFVDAPWSLARVWNMLQRLWAPVLVGWTHLARVVRGRFLSLREEDFVMAAVAAAASARAIIFGHLLPSFLSYVIVSLTLAVPGMILGETALSFLGLGIQPPAVSWGTLLQDAQNFQAVSRQPWLLIPCLFVVLTVLLYNFLGDGMRAAADPYS